MRSAPRQKAHRRSYRVRPSSRATTARKGPRKRTVKREKPPEGGSLSGRREVRCEARPRCSRLQGFTQAFLRSYELGATRLVRRGLCWLAVGIGGHVGSFGRRRWLVRHRSRLTGSCADPATQHDTTPLPKPSRFHQGELGHNRRRTESEKGVRKMAT